MPSWEIDFELPLDLGNRELVVALAKAEALAHTVRSIPVSPFAQAQLDRLNIIRAVRGTTVIEGADLSEEDVRLILSSPAPALAPSRSRDEQEARNADATMRYISGLLDREPAQPLTEMLIKQINELLTQGIDYPHHIPGHYRSHGVSALTYMAPRPEAVPELMEAFIRWLNAGPCLGWPPIARAVAAHFYFVSIHPFGDGNGRTARAIESYLLYQSQVNVFGFYSLANFYYRNRATYVVKLDEVRFMSHSLTPFVRFAADGLVEELEAVHKEVVAYLQGLVQRDWAEETLKRAKLSTKTRERLGRVLDALSEGPVALRQLRAGTHPLSVLYRGASIRTLERDIDQLEGLGLLQRNDGFLQLAMMP
ncbi:MAG TPA: Fic family protein [Dehalococcoidia bacterium]|nr:Fic family protein [Dehalococcoidia bacterium]